jgi:hypothetical protein
MVHHAQHDQDAEDDDDVGQHRRPAAAELTPRGQQRGISYRDSEEEDLDGEDSCEGRLPTAVLTGIHLWGESGSTGGRSRGAAMTARMVRTQSQSPRQ